MLDAGRGESWTQANNNGSSVIRGENQANGEGASKFSQRDGKEIKYLRTKDGTVYGFTYKGKIYLDPKIADSNVAIHEFTHLWAEMYRKEQPEEWAHIKEVMQSEEMKPIWDEVTSNPMYANLSTDELCEEVLATYSGRKGQQRLHKWMQRIHREQPRLSDRTVARKAVRRWLQVTNRCHEMHRRLKS